MATEKRLVWSDDVLAFLCKRCNELYSDEPCEPSDCLMLEELEKCKTVDAVEVVRCKDCKYWDCWRSSGEGSGYCNLDEGYQTLATQHYDFCSYGERKDHDLK